MTTRHRVVPTAAENCHWTHPLYGVRMKVPFVEPGRVDRRIGRVPMGAGGFLDVNGDWPQWQRWTGQRTVARRSRIDAGALPLFTADSRRCRIIHSVRFFIRLIGWGPVLENEFDDQFAKRFGQSTN